MNTGMQQLAFLWQQNAEKTCLRIPISLAEVEHIKLSNHYTYHNQKLQAQGSFIMEPLQNTSCIIIVEKLQRHSGGMYYKELGQSLGA